MTTEFTIQQNCLIANQLILMGLLINIANQFALIALLTKYDD